MKQHEWKVVHPLHPTTYWVVRYEGHTNAYVFCDNNVVIGGPIAIEILKLATEVDNLRAEIDLLTMRRESRMQSVKSKAPCWWCSRQLQSWIGVKVIVDGIELVVHIQCLKEMECDEDFAHRMKIRG